MARRKTRPKKISSWPDVSFLSALAATSRSALATTATTC